MNDKLKKLISENILEKDGKKKLPCAKAFYIAGQLGISLKEIGAHCDSEGIKISACQLGCFK